jgi:TPR repeat protein
MKPNGTPWVYANPIQTLRYYEQVTNSYLAERMEASYRLGVLYLNGCQGIPKNLSASLRYFKIVSDEERSPGDRRLRACFEVSKLYLKGGPGIEISLFDAEYYDKKGFAILSSMPEMQGKLVECFLMVRKWLK